MFGENYHVIYENKISERSGVSVRTSNDFYFDFTHVPKKFWRSVRIISIAPKFRLIVKMWIPSIVQSRVVETMQCFHKIWGKTQLISRWKVGELTYTNCSFWGIFNLKPDNYSYCLATQEFSLKKIYYSWALIFFRIVVFSM